MGWISRLQVPKGTAQHTPGSASRGRKGLSLAPDRAHAYEPWWPPPPRPATTDHSDRSRRATSRPSEERAGATGDAGRLRRWVGRRGPRGCGASAEYTRPPLRPERRPPLCPSKTHSPRLTLEAGNQKQRRRTSQKVGGTPRTFSLCFGTHLTGGRPPFKDTEGFF